MHTFTHDSALLLFSGGQDSSISLAWALNRFSKVYTLGFSYGQRHHVEMSCRTSVRDAVDCMHPHWHKRLADDTILDSTLFTQIGETAMTSGMAIAFSEQGLPNTFVPGRNLLFLTVAAALAYRKKVPHLILGVCEADYSGYPDCRDTTIKAMQVALSLGMDTALTIHTPLMWLTKAESWHLAHEEGGEGFVKLVLEESHTCYLGTRDTRHAWGYGCGTCPACTLRAKGWEQYVAGMHTGAEGA